MNECLSSNCQENEDATKARYKIEMMVAEVIKLIQINKLFQQVEGIMMNMTNL